jgi:predicted cupin superfamily sugar epimerase/uncharacterized protein (DUF952 family)
MIWHLLPLSRWQSAGSGPYVPGTAEAVPFVHASPDERVALAVANARFGETAEPLVALALAESRLSAPVRFEPADPAPPPGVPDGTLFPHVYGPVETSAVTEIRYARRDPSGRYTALDRRPATADALDLVPHPEGGWFRETWVAGPPYTPAGYPGRRAAATGIYFLLPPGTESCWHLVRSDELWLWHSGGPLTMLLGGAGPQPAEEPEAVSLGPDLARGEQPQRIVRGGCWQAARPAGPHEVLVTCVVAPGFDFADFTALPAEAEQAGGEAVAGSLACGYGHASVPGGVRDPCRPDGAILGTPRVHAVLSASRRR